MVEVSGLLSGLVDVIRRMTDRENRLRTTISEHDSYIQARIFAAVRQEIKDWKKELLIILENDR